MAATSQSTIISHWYNLIENLQASPMEFYASLERAIERREIPCFSLETRQPLRVSGQRFPENLDRDLAARRICG